MRGDRTTPSRIRCGALLALGGWLLSAGLVEMTCLHVETDHHGSHHADAAHHESHHADAAHHESHHATPHDSDRATLADDHGSHEHQLSSARTLARLSARPELPAPAPAVMPVALAGSGYFRTHAERSAPRTRGSPHPGPFALRI